MTNKDVEHAIQNYFHRLGSNEYFFKNQKINGLYLEAINNASEKAYNTMYTMALYCCAFSNYFRNRIFQKFQML